AGLRGDPGGAAVAIVGVQPVPEGGLSPRGEGERRAIDEHAEVAGPERDEARAELEVPIAQDRDLGDDGGCMVESAEPERARDTPRLAVELEHVDVFVHA